MIDRTSFAKEQIRKAKSEKSKSLDISQCALQEFPIEILDLSHLEKLTLGGFYHRFEHEIIGESGFYNEISSIPKDIHKLKNLKYLDLTLCPNLSLPSEFGQLSQLEVLNLIACGLNEIPDPVYELKSLRKLNLYSIPDVERLAFHKGYSYQDFDDEYRLLAEDLHFEELMHHWGDGERFINSISSISSKILTLKELKVLNLNGNQIKEYPEFIDYHPSLEEVSMYDNALVLHPINDERRFNLEYNLIPTLKTSEYSFEDSLLDKFDRLIKSKANPKTRKSLENSKIFFMKGEYSDSLKIIYPKIEEMLNEILISNGINPNDRNNFRGLLDKITKLIDLEIIPNELFEFIAINKPRNRILHGSYRVVNEQYLYPTSLASFIFISEVMEKLT